MQIEQILAHDDDVPFPLEYAVIATAQQTDARLQHINISDKRYSRRVISNLSLITYTGKFGFRSPYVNRSW